MKRFFIVGLAVGLVAVLAVTFQSGHSEAATDPFVGEWQATDVLDGSSMTMWIRADRRAYDIVWYDDLATVACDPDSPAILFGRGWAFGAILLTRMEMWCLSATPSFGGSGSGAPLVYDASTDTLLSIEPVGVNVWQRR